MFESVPAAEAWAEWRRVRHQAVDAGVLNIYLQAFDVHAQASREWREHVEERDDGAGAEMLRLLRGGASLSGDEDATAGSG